MTSGKVISARYELGDLIGSGAMGDVYRAVDAQTGETVAIKHLKPDLLHHDRNLLARFRREGDVLRELNHPNIVSLLDVISEEDDHYLIMEYVPGGDLKTRIEEAPQGLPAEQVLSLALDLADALTRAHRLELIHRDIKPANVLIAEDGTPRLSDFGIALHSAGERLTQSNAIIGTMAYIAPEAINGEAIDTRADVWSFGVMLFEMLAGQRPFQGDTLVSLLASVLNKPVPDLEQRRPDCPVALADLVYRMLERDPLARIPGVRHVGAELEDILQGRDTSQTGSRFATPLPRNWTRPRHNLPPQSTPFVGRELELAELRRIITDREVGFVSMVAPGGMGKTRLALALAEAYCAEDDVFKDGVYFVELAPLGETAAIVPAIAGATGYQFSGDGRDTRQQILDFLSNKHMLLVLDNFEHLLDGASMVTEICQAAPDVVVLTTSRQRLEEPGENLFQIAGMDFPDWETQEDARAYAAVKLFMSTARRVQPGFDLTAANMDYVARICRLVGGTPLGIVLAASWLAVLSPREIVDEVQHGLDILETTGGEVEARHQSMRAVCDQSWALMTEDEQQVFAQLSVFRGGFTREAIQAITGVDLRTLMSLSNKSLIRRRVSTGRFEIHELLRQYGTEKLSASGAEEAIREAHSTFFIGALVNRGPHFKDSQQLKAAQEIDAEFDNLTAAWNWAIRHKRSDLLEDAPIPLHDYGWLRLNRVYEVLKLFDTALDALASDAELPQIQLCYARLLSTAAALRFSLQYDSAECIQMAQDAFDILENVGGPFDIAFTLTTLGWWEAMSGGDLEKACLLFDNAYQRFSDLDSPAASGNVLSMKAVTLKNMGQPVRESFEIEKQSVDLLRKAGDRFTLAVALNWMGHSLRFLGEYGQAQSLFSEAWQLEQAIQSIGNACLYLDSLKDIAVARGDYQQAQDYLEEAITIVAHNNFPYDHALLLREMAEVMSLIGQYDRASELIAEAGQIWPGAIFAGSRATLAYRRGHYREAIDLFSDLLGEAHGVGWVIDASLWLGLTQIKTGQIEAGLEHLRNGLKEAYRTERRFQYPRGVYGVAEIRCANGHLQQAAELAALVAENDVTPHEFKVYARKLLDKLEQDLTQDVYEAAYERGTALDLDTVVKQLLDEDLAT